MITADNPILRITGIVVLWALMAANPLRAQEESAPDQGKEGQELSNTERLAVMDRMHQYVTGEVIETSEWVDRFLGKERAASEQNLSYIRLRLDVEDIEEFGSDFSPRLSAKLRFTEDGKTSVRVGRDEDGVFDPEGGDGGSIGSPRFGDSDEAEGGVALGYDLVRSDKTLLDLSGGVRRRDSDYQFYGRFKFFTRDGLGEHWVGILRNDLYYFSRSGWENRASYTFERIVGQSNNKFFRYKISAIYRENKPGYFFNDRFSFFHITSPKSMWAYELLGYYQTKEDPETGERRDGNELWLRYRRNIYRPWMFTEIRPMVGWPVERDYETTWGILVRLEFIFGSRGAIGNRLKDID